MCSLVHTRRVLVGLGDNNSTKLRYPLASRQSQSNMEDKLPQRQREFKLCNTEAEATDDEQLGALADDAEPPGSSWCLDPPGSLDDLASPVGLLLFVQRLVTSVFLTFVSTSLSLQTEKLLRRLSLKSLVDAKGGSYGGGIRLVLENRDKSLMLSQINGLS